MNLLKYEGACFQFFKLVRLIASFRSSGKCFYRVIFDYDECEHIELVNVSTLSAPLFLPILRF